MKKYIELEKPGFNEFQLAGVYCEERDKVGVEQRINPYVLERKNGRVDFKFDETMQFAQVERRGMENMFELAKDGYDLIFWFSPSGGEYIDGRVVVARTSKVAGDDVKLECRGIVLQKSPQAIYKMAEEILANGGVTMDGFSGPDDLRSQPVGIKLSRENWIDFSQRIIGVDEVWQAIRQGKDVSNKEKIGKEVMEVLTEMETMKIRGDRNYLFELMMLQRGYQLNAMGNHGSSNLTEITKVCFDRQVAIFDRLFGIVEVAVKAERIDGKWVCPCGQVIGDGESRCPKCKAKISKKGLQ